MDAIEIGEGVLAVIGSLTLLKGAYRATATLRKKSDSNIGRIFLRGEIKEYASTSTPLGRREDLTPQRVEELVESALKDGVRGLIFDIDSPGGSVVPSKEIADYVGGIEVPTVALVKGYAASGAYWVASACDTIVANEFSMVGSIGVILSHIEFSELAQRYGIRYDGVQSGKFKDMGNPFRAFTVEERQILQEELDAVHAGFVHAVAENRELEKERVEAVANGLIYHGNKALELGLVDVIGDLDDAIEIIEEAGEFTHQKVVDYEPKKGLRRLLEGSSIAYGLGRSIARGFLDTLQSQNKIDLR